MNIFKRIATRYKNEVKELEKGSLEEGLSIHGFFARLWIYSWALISTPCDSYYDFICGRKISPFLKEFILSFSKWLHIGPLIFLLLVVLKYTVPIDDSLVPYVFQFLVCFPLGTVALFFIFMSTPRQELMDKVFNCRIIHKKNVTIGSIDSFRTSIDYDFRDPIPPQSGMCAIDEKETWILPAKIYCTELLENHIAHSSTPKLDWDICSYHEMIEDESTGEVEVTDPFLVNMACTDEERKQMKLRIKIVLTADIVGWFEDLYELEPSLEFQLEYLHFSKLLTGIYPIEGYEYAEGVPDILENITNAVHPWLKRKKK